MEVVWLGKTKLKNNFKFIIIIIIIILLLLLFHMQWHYFSHAKTLKILKWSSIINDGVW